MTDVTRDDTHPPPAAICDAATPGGWRFRIWQAWAARLGWSVGPNRLSIGGETLIFAALIAVPLLWPIGHLFPPINHDAALLVDVAQRWLEGERLYVEVIDVNTPLVFIIYAIPVVLSWLVPLSPESMLVLSLMGAIGLSFLLCWRVLHLSHSRTRPLTGALIPMMALFLMAVFPNDMFGQREHLLVIAGLPYMLLAGARADGARVSPGLTAGVAIFAGLMFAMKPYFLAIPAFVEFYLLWIRGWRTAWRDMVPWIIGAVCVAHLAFAITVTPEYFTFLMPMALKYYAPLGNADPWTLLTGPLIAPTVLALIPLTAAALVITRSRLALGIALFALGATFSSVAQAKGWAYQSLPALSATLMLAGVVIAGMIDRYLPLAPAAHRLPVTVISAGLMLIFYYQAAIWSPPFLKQRFYDDSDVGRLQHLIEQNASNKKILVLSPGVYPHFPAINYAGVRNTMRFESTWLLQGIYSGCDEQEFSPLYNAPEDMEPAEQFIFRNVAENFAKQKPSLLIVDKVAGIPRCQARTFNYLDYFLRNPLFARTFAGYEPLLDFDRYQIYRRK